MPGDGVRGHGHRSVVPFRAVPAEVRLGRWSMHHAVEEAELVVA